MTPGSSNRPKPRVLVVTSMFPRWDADSEPGFVFELSRRLTGRFDVRVVAPHAPGAATQETMGGVEVVRYRYMVEALECLAYDGGILPKLRKAPWKWLLVPLFLFAQYRAVRRQMRAWRPHILHAHWILPQGWIVRKAIGRRRDWKFVVTAHGTDVFGLNSSWMRKLKRNVLERADAVTIVGQAMRDAVIALGARAPDVSVEPMGVDLSDRFTPDSSTQRSRDEVLFVGRLIDIKGVNHLLDAAPAILARRPTTRFTIAGFGPEEASLRRQANALGLGDRVTFAGPVAHADLPRWYRRAAVFVAPFVQARTGEQEGFGLVLVEALGCGCPVVASALPALRDLLADRAENLVEPGNVASLADAVVRVLSDPQAAAAGAEALRQRIVGRLDWAAVSARYAELIDSLAGEGQQARISEQ